ncbi:MAG TPA: Crp/Fnr family transcriptional regulator [Gammaproteobacteria bacterium]|nr:Crp/Fnr family transcriptional regulator [Gammaproteobacteria bacterium]
MHDQPPDDPAETALGDCYLFDGLPADDLAAVRAQMGVRRYRRHTLFIERGDEAARVFFLVRGRVEAFVADAEGREVVLDQSGPGTVLGELALLADLPRTASVRTLEDSEFRVLGRAAFFACLERHPAIALNLARALARQVHGLTGVVSDFALLDVYGRVAKLLRESAAEEAGRLVTPRWTHQQIADRVGASREMVSKILKELRIGGYVAVEGKRYVLQRKLPARW